MNFLKKIFKPRLTVNITAEIPRGNENEIYIWLDLMEKIQKEYGFNCTLSVRHYNRF